MKCAVCGYEGPSLSDLLKPGVKITVKLAMIEVAICPKCGVVQAVNLEEILEKMKGKPKSSGESSRVRPHV